MIKREYQDEQADGSVLNYGYNRPDAASHPFLWMESSDELITLQLSPSHLRKLAMRLIKLSYRVDAQL